MSPQDALRIANHVRFEAVRCRRELVGRPMVDVVQAIIHPPEPLARMRLRHLFARTGPDHVGPVPRFGRVKLERALADASRRRRYGRRLHSELRLGEMTEAERRHLARAIVALAPRWWREA